MGQRDAMARRPKEKNIDGVVKMREKLREQSNLGAVALPDARHTVGAHCDQAPWLAEHDFRGGRRDFFAEQTKPAAFLAIGPRGKLIWRGIVSQIRRATAHNEAEHHLRFAVIL